MTGLLVHTPVVLMSRSPGIDPTRIEEADSRDHWLLNGKGAQPRSFINFVALPHRAALRGWLSSLSATQALALGLAELGPTPGLPKRRTRRRHGFARRSGTKPASPRSRPALGHRFVRAFVGQSLLSWGSAATDKSLSIDSTIFHGEEPAV
jgi:hypothetical protein